MAHFYEYQCELCARSIVTKNSKLWSARGILCPECQYLRKSWDSLTPDGREAELNAMTL
jgi:hypothetical protein